MCITLLPDEWVFWDFKFLYSRPQFIPNYTVTNLPEVDKTYVDIISIFIKLFHNLSDCENMVKGGHSSQETSLVDSDYHSSEHLKSS